MLLLWILVLAPLPLRAETTVVLTLSTEDPCKLLLSKLPAGAKGRRFELKGLSLDGDPLLYQVCDKLRGDLAGAAESWLKDASGYSSAQAQFTGHIEAIKQDVYNQFLQFVAEQVYAQLPPDDQRRFGPDSPDMQQKALEWLHQPGQEVTTYVHAFLESKSDLLAALFRDYMSGGSMQIITGLQGVLKSAQDKLKRFTEVSHEIEEQDTPLGDALSKHGLSGDYVDRFKGYEHKVRSLDKQFKLAEAVGIVVDSMQTDNPETKISGFFNLLSWAGSVAEDSKLPMVSLVGQIVSAYADVAKEMLNQVNKLEDALRKREGYCIGLAMHSTRDPKDKAFLAQFGDGIRACPIATQGHLVNVFVQAQPDDASQLYFWDGEKFIKGREGGGGVPAMRQAIGLILRGEDLDFPAYTGKAQDIPTIAAVYNTPYPQDKLRGHDRQQTAGLSGLLEEADRVIGEIHSQIRTLKGAVDRFDEDACSPEKMADHLDQVTGKDTARFEETYEQSAGDLKTSYALGFVEKYRAELKGAARRPAAYNTYSVFWDKINKLSMLKIHGTVKNKNADIGACSQCGGAEISVSVSSGQELPGCEVRRADAKGGFTVYALTESTDVAVRLSAAVEGRSSASETIDRSIVTLGEPPFVESFSFDLRVPLEPQEGEEKPGEAPPVDLTDLFGEMETVAANAQTVSDNIRTLCQSARQNLQTGESGLSALRSEWTAFQSRLEQLKSRQAELRQTGNKLNGLVHESQQQGEASVRAKKETETHAGRACDLAQALQRGQRTDIPQVLGEAKVEGQKAEAANQTAQQAFQKTRALADRVQALLKTFADPLREVKETQQAGQALKTRLEEIRTGLSQAASDAEQAAAQKASLEGFRLRGAQLLEDGKTQLKPLQGSAGYDEQVKKLEGLYGRIASATTGEGGCDDLPAQVLPLKTEADVLANHLDSALAQIAAMQPAGPAAGAGWEEAAAETRANADTAEVFAEAAQSAATQAGQCVQLARAVTQKGPDKIFTTAQVALDACEFSKALSLIQQLGADPRAAELMTRYRERIRHESQTKAWFQEGDTLFKNKEYEKSQAVLERALNHTRCEKYKTRIQGAISQVLTARAAPQPRGAPAPPPTGGGPAPGGTGPGMEEAQPYYVAFQIYVLFPTKEPPKVEVPPGADKATRERIRRQNQRLLEQFARNLTLSDTRPELLDKKGESPAVIGIGPDAQEAFPLEGFTPGAKFSIPMSGNFANPKGGSQAFRTALLLKTIGVFESREAVFARFPKLAEQAAQRADSNQLWEQAVLRDANGTFTVSDPKQGNFTAGPLAQGWTRANMQASLEFTRLILSMFGALSCFVATAVYEDPNAEALDALRTFRDAVLLESAAGRRLVRLYYEYGPGLAERVKGYPKLAAALRAGFDRFAGWLHDADLKESWKRQWLEAGVTVAEVLTRWLPQTPKPTPAEIRARVQKLLRSLGAPVPANLPVSPVEPALP